MDSFREKEPNSFDAWKIFAVGVLAAVILSLLVGYSYYWNIDKIFDEKINLALAEAKASWNKDDSFRKWATRHGGLYVKVSERTPPNPYLAHLPHRDLTTTDGTKLTLMNPAFMVRQLIEEYGRDYGIMGKITGKVQINPINKPDDWQNKTLNLFESGLADEFYEKQNVDGKPYLRYMKALYMTQGCEECHSHLGFQNGDLRGAVSVSVPLAPYFTAASKTKRGVLITHLIIWAIGLAAILCFLFLVKKLLTQMAHKTFHDVLTKLPNTSLFKNRLAQSLDKYNRDNDRLFAVCFMDLDRFKNLNDSYGHSVGDNLLIELADRLGKLLRPGDTVARMGGDEFTFLLDDVSGLDETITIAERILEVFNKPFKIANDEIYSNASIGICLASSEYATASEMIRNADIAMYRAKKSGKDRIDVFNSEMHDQAIQIMQIENDLRTAIEKQQLSIHYQPVIDLKNNRITGFEALLRWNHPVMGSISPDQFIPIAESTGQIKKIGAWVLEKACAQVHEWNLQFSPEQGFSIAVNLSGAQVVAQDITQVVEDILKSTNIGAEKLYLEVTETMLVQQKELAKAAIEQIRGLGVSISIDDFGRGHCSLAYLQEFDFDVLKIDKYFIQNMNRGGKGLQLVRMLISLANNLKMKIIAEGVETENQLDQLKNMECPYIQGYYFSRPLPADDVQLMLGAGSHLNASLLLKRSDPALEVNPERHLEPIDKQ